MQIADPAQLAYTPSNRPGLRNDANPKAPANPPADHASTAPPERSELIPRAPQPAQARAWVYHKRHSDPEAEPIREPGPRVRHAMETYRRVAEAGGPELLPRIDVTV